MSISQHHPTLSEYNYRPAILHEYKSGWLIEYYCENPVSKKMQRKTIKMNLLVSRYKNKRDARMHVNKIVSSLNIKLAKGWNPFFESEDARLYSKVSDVLILYLQEKEKELRENTMRSYKSFVSLFSQWINSNFSDIYSGMVNATVASRFMDYVYNDRNVGQTSYNNYLKMGRAIFNWMVEKCYCKENPFAKLKLKKKQKKSRIMIDAETRKQIINYLEVHNPQFLVVCKLVFYSLIRPNEIRQIKIGDINLPKHYIVINDDVAKNHKTRFAALTPDLINDLKKMNIEKYPANYFLFSGELSPGPSMAGSARYRKEWDKLRKELKLPQQMQLYSFRDTAIFEMIKHSGIDDLTVMQHADHHSLEMTTIYADHYDPNLINTIFEKAPKF